jgi:hypothetical protein
LIKREYQTKEKDGKEKEAAPVEGEKQTENGVKENEVIEEGKKTPTIVTEEQKETPAGESP